MIWEMRKSFQECTNKIALMGIFPYEKDEGGYHQKWKLMWQFGIQMTGFLLHSPFFDVTNHYSVSGSTSFI